MTSNPKSGLHKNQNIILCGFMGTGKSTVGQLLASRLGWRFADTDKVIESRQGRTIPQIFTQAGEPAFRELERALCQEIIDWHKTVIATGGGVPVNPENRAALLEAGLVICLDAPPAEIARRLTAEAQPDRPMLASADADPTARVTELMAIRKAAYDALPNHINTGGVTPNQIVELIISQWKRATNS